MAAQRAEGERSIGKRGEGTRARSEPKASVASGPEEAPLRELVLVGGGHAHVQVLRRLGLRPIPGVHASVVLDRPRAVYSGMVPGFVAGEYAAAELEIDVASLARRAGASVVLARAVRIDPRARRIELEDRPALGYDVASLDVGSSVRGLELPGVREFALATRPIRALVDSLDARLQALHAPRIAVVGAGVAGLELAFGLSTRMGVRPCVLGEEILPRYAARARARLCALAAARGIELRAGARVIAVEKNEVVLAGGERVAADLVVWATGAAAPELLRDSPLPLDSAGFVRVHPSLQVVGSDTLFAVGDCASLEDQAWVPKAGVYAVRQGPRLDANLRALLTGRPLRAYRPQRDFLSLMNLGGRRALGTKWGAVLAGRAVWRLKDRIDRRFVRRFRV
jgi:selenide,water dikinase